MSLCLGLTSSLLEKEESRPNRQRAWMMMREMADVVMVAERHQRQLQRHQKIKTAVIESVELNRKAWTPCCVFADSVSIGWRGRRPAMNLVMMTCDTCSKRLEHTVGLLR